MTRSIKQKDRSVHCFRRNYIWILRAVSGSVDLIVKKKELNTSPSCLIFWMVVILQSFPPTYSAPLWSACAASRAWSVGSVTWGGMREDAKPGQSGDDSAFRDSCEFLEVGGKEDTDEHSMDAGIRRLLDVWEPLYGQRRPHQGMSNDQIVEKGRVLLPDLVLLINHLFLRDSLCIGLDIRRYFKWFFRQSHISNRSDFFEITSLFHKDVRE
jgi:hypothetical protein